MGGETDCATGSCDMDGKVCAPGEILHGHGADGWEDAPGGVARVLRVVP